MLFLVFQLLLMFLVFVCLCFVVFFWFSILADAGSNLLCFNIVMMHALTVYLKSLSLVCCSFITPGATYMHSYVSYETCS